MCVSTVHLPVAHGLPMTECRILACPVDIYLPHLHLLGVPGIKASAHGCWQELSDVEFAQMDL